MLRELSTAPCYMSYLADILQFFDRVGVHGGGLRTQGAKKHLDCSEVCTDFQRLMG